MFMFGLYFQSPNRCNQSYSAQMTNCTTAIAHHFSTLLHDTGRAFFHKGHYEDCIDQPDLKYSFVQLGINGTYANVFTGLCIPRACPDELISKQLNQTMVKAGLPLNIYAVSSYTQPQSFPLTWVSYLTLILLSLFVLLTLYSTLKHKLSPPSALKTTTNKLVSSFDLIANMKHFQVRPNEPLNILDGVRAISMMWVIFGHTYIFYFFALIINTSSVLDISKQTYFLVAEAGLLSVDVFFLLGGFFLAFVALREKASSVPKSLLAIPLRIMRIWPAYIMTMLFFFSWFMQLGSGPYWFLQKVQVDACTNMWKEVFFYSNLVSTEAEICVQWGWYLQVDFQLFLLGLFLIIIYRSYPKLSLTLSTVLGVASLVFNFANTYVNKIHIYADFTSLANPNYGKYFKEVYMSPWGRCTPYLMGLALGCFYMSFRGLQRKGTKEVGAEFMLFTKRTLGQSRFKRIMVEWTGIAIMAFVTFCPRPLQLDSYWPQSLHSLYWALSKPIFLLGMVMVVLPSMLGIRGSFFQLILTNKLFVFIARISFCTYLVHLIVINQFYATRNFDVYYNTLEAFVFHCGFNVISLFFGFLLTMVVELPFAHMQKHLVSYLLKTDKKVEKREAKASLLTNKESFSKEESKEVLDPSINHN